MMPEKAQRRTEKRERRYRRSVAAEDEVLRRLTLAVNRLRVVSQFHGESLAGIVAQTGHAVHFVEIGFAEDSRDVPPEAPDFQVGHNEAEQLVCGLASMLARALSASTTVGEAD